MVSLSIIIPTYNRASLLERTLISLVRQNSHDFSIILVDHGSTENIFTLVEQYDKKVSIEYCWVPRAAFSPAIPRDFGARQAKSPLIAFLDSGIVVPSSYVASHIAFHHSSSQASVGIGLCHGHSADPQDQRWEQLLRLPLDDAGPIFAQLAPFCDRRKRQEIDPAAWQLPWLFAWSGNMSLHRENYLTAGGFNRELEGWGFEDLDLAYRLFKQGSHFAFIENGWGIHLPHPKEVGKTITQPRNAKRCYWKQRTMALEAALYTELAAVKSGQWREIREEKWETMVEETFTYLAGLKAHIQECAIRSMLAHYSFPRPSLLVGATCQASSSYDYLALADDTFLSTELVWSCCGVLLPLEDHSLATAVVLDLWKWLDRSFYKGTISLLECLISEMKRTAQQVFFVDSVPALAKSENNQAAKTSLESLCRKYQLPFKLLTLPLDSASEPL
jgi:GT2 family glycosyltransferase